MQLDALGRRLEMAERERARGADTLAETQARLEEAEERLARAAGELATSRALEGRLQARLVGGKSGDEAAALAARADAAEAAAAAAEAERGALVARAEAGERAAKEAAAAGRRQLADVTNLRRARLRCSRPCAGWQPCKHTARLTLHTLTARTRPPDCGAQVRAAQRHGGQRRGVQGGPPLCGAGAGARKGGPRARRAQPKARLRAAAFSRGVAWRICWLTNAGKYWNCRKCRQALARGCTRPPSELERLDLERQGRALRQQVARLTAALAGQQDRARCGGGRGAARRAGKSRCAGTGGHAFCMQHARPPVDNASSRRRPPPPPQVGRVRAA